jgi:hypothetical protein
MRRRAVFKRQPREGFVPWERLTTSLEMWALTASAVDAEMDSIAQALADYHGVEVRWCWDSNMGQGHYKHPRPKEPVNVRSDENGHPIACKACGKHVRVESLYTQLCDDACYDAHYCS